MPGFQELLVIGLVAVLVLGPNRLPKAAADVARLLARFRREAQGALSDLKGQAEVDGIGDDLRMLNRELRDTRGLAKRTLNNELRALTETPTPPTGPSPSAPHDHGNQD
jgi:sec-independent protein translocase protein TatB